MAVSVTTAAPPRVVSPPLTDLATLRTPLTAGETQVLEYFLRNLSRGWEIYLQPHLNGLRPDFVLLHPECGIAVYEVKDWDLNALDYFVAARDGRGPILKARSRDGETFSLEKQNPVTKIQAYKNEIFNLYCPRLPQDKGLGSIVAGVIFPNAQTKDVVALLHPLQVHYGQHAHERLYPLIGADLLKDDSASGLRAVLPSARKYDERMSEFSAADLRHWLVEPEFSAEQRRPLANDMTPEQRALCVNKAGVRHRRLKGPAGSGKSLVLAGRAAELAKAGKRVLIVTYNITLINYLMDLAVRYAQSGKVRGQIVALNFHHWCKRVALDSGRITDYDALWPHQEEDSTQDNGAVLDHQLPNAVFEWLDDLDESQRWDAVLVDEGQDFHSHWWKALRRGLRNDELSEALLCADAHQNVYGVKPWTDEQMLGAGFRGPWATLDKSFRMSPALCRLASVFIDTYMPDVDVQRPDPPDGEFEFKTVLKWWQVAHDGDAEADACVAALMDMVEHSDPPIAYADLVCLVDNATVGLAVVRKLHQLRFHCIHTFGSGTTEREVKDDSRRKKLAFFKGDGRIKVTTLHSFKGWESKAMVVNLTRASSREDLALCYAGITRLKRDDFGCYLTVVNSAPELTAYGHAWPQFKS